MRVIYERPYRSFWRIPPDLDNTNANSAYINDTYYGGILRIRILEGGLYMIRVAEGIGLYTLTVTESYFGETVGTLTAGQSVQGTLSRNSFDRWLITLSADQRVDIELRSASSRTYLSFCDRDGNRWDYSNARGQENNFIASLNDIRILSTDLYMIQVAEGIGDYTLTVRLK